MEKTTLQIEIEGMSCGHCVKTVRTALEGIPGVEILEVVIGRAVVDMDETAPGVDVITATIDDTGFLVKSIG